MKRRKRNIHRNWLRLTVCSSRVKSKILTKAISPLLLRFCNNCNAPTVTGREILYQQKVGGVAGKQSAKKESFQISPIKMKRDLETILSSQSNSQAKQGSQTSPDMQQLAQNPNHTASSPTAPSGPALALVPVQPQALSQIMCLKVRGATSAGTWIATGFCFPGEIKPHRAHYSRPWTKVS